MTADYSSDTMEIKSCTTFLSTEKKMNFLYPVKIILQEWRWNRHSQMKLNNEEKLRECVTSRQLESLKESLKEVLQTEGRETRRKLGTKGMKEKQKKIINIWVNIIILLLSF